MSNNFQTQIINKKTKLIVTGLMIILMILVMDFFQPFVRSDPTNEYTFFYDDFAFSTTNSTELWKGEFDTPIGFLVVEEGNICWTDFSITGWSGYTKIILKAELPQGASSSSGRILIRDAYSYEILYAVHPSQMTDEIDLSSYVDLTSTSIKIEIHGYAKFNSIKVYTPNLFIHNLLLDKAADEFGTEILGNPLNEEGLNPVFNGYSKFFEFSPGTYHAENFQTSEYFIPYMEEINLDGMFSRSYYEEEECHNDTIVITIQVVERYGKSYEIHTIYENSEYLDGRATSIRISLAQFIGKDISFIVKLRVSTTRFESNFFPKLYCSYLGITAKSNAKVNSRAIEAYDYASKDMFTQITPAIVNNQEKLVLARDRQGPIATYRAFIGSETDTILCSGYDLSEYLDISSGHDGWKAGSGGNGLVADVEADYESLIMLNNEQPTLTSGFLDVSLNLNSYGIAAGIVFRVV